MGLPHHGCQNFKKLGKEIPAPHSPFLAHILALPFLAYHHVKMKCTQASVIWCKRRFKLYVCNRDSRWNTIFIKMRQSSDFETIFHFLRPQFFSPKIDLITLVLVGAIWTRLEDRKMNWISRMKLEWSWSCCSPIPSWKCTKSIYAQLSMRSFTFTFHS